MEKRELIIDIDKRSAKMLIPFLAVTGERVDVFRNLILDSVEVSN